MSTHSVLGPGFVLLDCCCFSFVIAWDDGVLRSVQNSFHGGVLHRAVVAGRIGLGAMEGLLP